MELGLNQACKGGAPCREERIELSRGRCGESLRYGVWCWAVGLTGGLAERCEVRGRAGSVGAGAARAVGLGPSGADGGGILRRARSVASAGRWRSSPEVRLGLELVMVRPLARRCGELWCSVGCGAWGEGPENRPSGDGQGRKRRASSADGARGTSRAHPYEQRGAPPRSGLVQHPFSRAVRGASGAGGIAG